MRGWSIALALPWVLAGLAVGFQERTRSSDETIASSSLRLADGGDVVLRYRTRAHDDDTVRRMRADPTVREALNERLPIVLGAELTVPVAVVASDVRLEPGTRRISLRMGEGGAWQLVILEGREFLTVPLDLVTTPHRFEWLSLTLTPARDGAFAIVLQWGPDLGRAIFRTAG